MAHPFEKSVFINCPFDSDYAPILQAVAFCIVFLGFVPRLAPENADNAEHRLDRIIEIIKGSKYGIHDLSRCKSTGKNQFYRLNMPFELGIDHGCRKFGGGVLSQKAILILEGRRYDYQKALSDISGWDIEAHGGDYQEAVRKVRGWMTRQAGAPKIGSALIQGKYVAFQEWYWRRELAAGASEDDIRKYPTVEVVDAMLEWVQTGQPD